MRKNDGGPAFPSNEIAFDGMRLRDYFAAAALTGIQQWDALVNKPGHSAFEGSIGLGLLAHTAFRIADAMLAERDK